jgi:glutamate synthase (NADPH/NADH) small chain
VLIAIGFASPVHDGIIAEVKPDLDKRGNVFADELSYKTTVDKLWAAGDMRKGQSLVVWAIREGRQAARDIDLTLMGKTTLPR